MSFFENIFGKSDSNSASTQSHITKPPTNDPTKNQALPDSKSSTVTDPNGLIPSGATADTQKSPEDKFAKLWETPPIDPNKQNEQAQNPTPQQLLEAASKVDFSRVLDQESLKKVTAGGEEAVQALVTLLNKTGQAVYGQNAVVTQKLIERAVEQAEAKFTERIPNLVRKQSARDGLITDNPAFNDPAVAPIVELIQNQLTLKYPTATASEIQKMAKEYFSGAATKLSPAPVKTKSSGQSDGSFDWDAWLTTPMKTSTE